MGADRCWLSAGYLAGLQCAAVQVAGRRPTVALPLCSCCLLTLSAAQLQLLLSQLSLLPAGALQDAHQGDCQGCDAEKEEIIQPVVLIGVPDDLQHQQQQR